MKKVTLFAAGFVLVCFTSCQRGCTKFNRSFQTSSREYEIKMYSGGQVVFQDKFEGILNNSEGSDGVYYYKGDTLIEVSGDYTVKSDK